MTFLRPFLFIIFLVFNAAVNYAQKTKPNIIFIMSDDHAYQAISAYQKDYIQTPNIDALASKGVLFQKSFVSNSICGPSRAVLLTGKHSHKNGVLNNGNAFNGKQQTFPKLLQKAGYQTALIGKWHLKGKPTGFSHYERLLGQGNYYKPILDINGRKDTLSGYVTDVVTDRGLDWVHKRDKNKPFALLLHHKAAHRVWMPPIKYLGKYDHKTFSLPDNFYDKYKGRKAASMQKMAVSTDLDMVYDLKMTDSLHRFPSKHRKTFLKKLARLTPEEKKAWDAYYQPIKDELLKNPLKGKALIQWKYNRYIQDYLACVASLDDNIGRVMTYLKENGLEDNTIVVYTSDQGFYLGEHGWYDKRFMYDTSMRTPLVVYVPEKWKGVHKVSNEMVQNIDLAPTFLDFAGAKIPEDMQGVSLKPVLTQNKVKDWRKSLYYHYYEYPNEHMVSRHYGIRTERYKLIRFYQGAEAWEFFDLKKDPKEMHNLINSKKHQAKIAELKTQLKQLQVEYDDTDESTY